MQLPFTSKPFIRRLNVGVKRRFQRQSSLEICAAFSLRANKLSRRGVHCRPNPHLLVELQRAPQLCDVLK